ncbi:MAG: hypothetical protein J4215_01150 [Candidatus Diapherotrites archaeon]|uniref:Class III signal peptide-containing protein n=1 Tax=Candidatus Iainarchaeum sp. TaxID=3101447 RepID=A0A8T4L319_9ARCH|nr:hypothetical protein [Candidatus Diapherotrites archaeon]
MSSFFVEKRLFYYSHGCLELGMGFFFSKRCQVSVEMIIILAAVVALVLLLVSQLQKTGAEGAKKIGQKADDLFEKIDDIK